MTKLDEFKDNSKNISNSPKRKNQNVRDTSKEAFSDKKSKPSYEREWQRVGKVLKRIQPATRKMLSIESNLPINCITQYVKILIENGFAIEQAVKQKCKVTGVRAYYLEFIEQIGAVDLARPIKPPSGNGEQKLLHRQAQN